MKTLDGTVPTTNVLARLRALAHGSITSLDELRHLTSLQAKLLGSLLTVPVKGIPERIAVFIPSIRITHRADVPLPGISFWAHKHWHIHIRASDTVHDQVTTVLRELKRIIDYPLRGRLPFITGDEWEVITTQFAADVLALSAKQHQARTS